jgi:AraC family transcriptional regulator, regulatory protein of adaptative response / methylated-DNA-[protein]-cysteine methyltransferase
MNLALKEKVNSREHDNEELWRALTAKDRRFDGSFVFAVRTTGIYCRPSCPSRRPRREHVAFFDDAEAAEQAGFRACLRCRPKDAAVCGPVGIVRRVCEFIEGYQDENLKLETIADHVGLSSFHLQRTFKSVMGITPRQYAQAHRANKFKAEIRKGESVTRAMYDAGYGSSSRLYEKASFELGMTPATYGRGGRGAKISYTIAISPLGRLLVAATEKGICAVRLGDSDEALEKDLRDEFSAAQIERRNERLSDAVETILKHLKGEQRDLDLPLEIRATAFQRRVWEELRAIPYGNTRSYGEVAKAIGHPTAVRAVARACATNPVALVVPCHRVVREDKSLGGYRWGLKRKQKLLDHERILERGGNDAALN